MDRREENFFHQGTGEVGEAGNSHGRFADSDEKINSLTIVKWDHPKKRRRLCLHVCMCVLGGGGHVVGGLEIKEWG